MLMYAYFESRVFMQHPFFFLFFSCSLRYDRDTRPHYIRCIKPNDNAEPDEVSRVRVMEQLRYGGVLEAVRVARSGYPVRLPHKVLILERRSRFHVYNECNFWDRMSGNGI